MTQSFNPLDAVIRPVDITYIEGDHLQDIIKSSVKDPIQQNLCQVSIGGIVVPREYWSKTRPKAGQIIKVQIFPRGRGARKILRTVLTIAVIAAAVWLTGGAAAGLLGASFASGTIGAAVLGGVVGVVGQFAINAILPPPSFERPEQDINPLYTITNTRNQGRADQVVPLIFGRHRFAFDLLTEQYQQVVGTDTYLVFLACAGIGNYDVQNIRIGETPITDYDGVIIQKSLLINSPKQTLLQGDFTQENVGINLENTSSHSRVVPAGTSDIDVVFDFPRGLGSADDRGRPQNVSVGLSVRYRQIDDTDWQTLAPDNGLDADDISSLSNLNVFGRRNFFQHNSNISSFSNNIPNTAQNQLTRQFTRRDNQPFRATMRLALPPGPAYEIEVRRTSAHNSDIAVGNDVTWSLLTAWSDVDLTPDPRMSVLAVRIKATDQLSGFVDQLNADIGKIIPTLTVDNPATFDPGTIDYTDWSTQSVSENCADILLDAILGPHTDDPHALSAINFESIAAFWQWCHIRNFRFGLPIIDDVSRRELMEIICNAGRGRPYYYRGQLHIAIDRERLEGPRQVIGPENARNFIFTRTFGGTNDALRVRFNNAENQYKEDLMTIYRAGRDETNAETFDEITLPGEIYSDQVYQKGRYIVDVAERANVIGRCEMDFEVETLQLGDYIRLQHPVLNAAASSGRILNQIGQSIILSERFQMDTDLDYVLVHRRIIGSDDDARLEVEGVYDLQTVAGEVDQVTLVNPLPADVIMNYDDLYVIGIRGEATFEALIQDIRPTGAYEAEVSFLTYLPDALTVPNIPAHTPIITSAFTGPPQPSFLSSNVNDDMISILFDMPALSSGLIQSFQCAYRISLKSDDSGESVSDWIEAPPLTGIARAFRFPIISMAQGYDVRIFAIDYDGITSQPLIVEDIAFTDFLIAPQNIQAFPLTQQNESGGAIPIVRFQFTTIENPDLISLIIEHRAATPDTAAPFNQIYSGPTSINEIDIHGLLPGAICDFRFAFQHQRGPLTRVDLRPILSNIKIPNSLVASDTIQVGGVSSVELLNNVTDSLAANEQLSNDVDDLFASVADGITAVSLDRDFIAASEARIQTIEENAEFIQSDINRISNEVSAEAGAVSQTLKDVLAIEDNVDDVRLEVISLKDQTATLNKDAQDAVTATAENVVITSAIRDDAEGFAAVAEAAQSLTAGLNGGVNNLVPGGLFEGDPQWVIIEATSAAAEYSIQTVAGEGSTLILDDNGNNYGFSVGSPSFKLTPGNRIIIGFRAKASAGPQEDGIFLRLNYKDSYARYIGLPGQFSHPDVSLRTGILDVINSRQTLVDSEFTDYEFEVNVPNQCEWASLTIYNWTNSNSRIEVSRAWVYDINERFQTAQLANIVEQQSVLATESAAAARSSAVLSATLSSNVINRNSNFIEYLSDNIAPPYWFDWQFPASRIRVDGRISPNAVRIVSVNNANAGLYQDVSNQRFGYYVVSATITLNAGDFRRAGMLLQAFNAASSAIDTDSRFNFFGAIDSSGNNVGLGVVGRTYHFTKIFNITNIDTDSLRIYAMNQWSGLQGGTQTGNDITWHEASFRPATSLEIEANKVQDLEAAVSINQGAIAENTGRNASFLELSATSSAGRVFAAIRSDSETGRAIILGTPELFITDPDGNNPQSAISLQGGSAILSGDITVGGGAYFGTGQGRIPFQLATRDFGNLKDGDVVAFNLPGTVPPTIRYNKENLTPLESGQSYSVRLENVTPTSAIVRTKRVSAGTPQSVSNTIDAAGGINEPVRVMNKTHADSNNQQYSFRVRGELTVQAFQTNGGGTVFNPNDPFSQIEYVGFAELETQFNTGSGYVPGPVISISHTDVGFPQSAGNYTYDKTVTVQFGDPIGQHGGNEFGISIRDVGTGVTITDLVSVAWSTATEGNAVSATTDGYSLSISVEPANVPG